jgi:hypothetical protein
MTSKTDSEQARDRMARTFFAVLDQTLPETSEPRASDPDLMGRAHILKEALFSAFLGECGLSTCDQPTGEDELGYRRGAD